MNKGSDLSSAERNLLTSALDKLEDFLSEKGHHLDRSSSRFGRDAEPADAQVQLKGKDVSLLLYAKPRLFESHINQMSANRLAPSRSAAILVTSEVSRQVFDRCRDAGIGVVDLQGNILLEFPGAYIERYRESRRPRKPSISGSVFTAKASRLVRALLAQYPKAWSQSELAETTEVSAGYVSTRVRLLEKEGYVVSACGRARYLMDFSSR